MNFFIINPSILQKCLKSIESYMTELFHFPLLYMICLSNHCITQYFFCFFKFLWPQRVSWLYMLSYFYIIMPSCSKLQFLHHSKESHWIWKKKNDTHLFLFIASSLKSRGRSHPTWYVSIKSFLPSIRARILKF